MHLVQRLLSLRETRVPGRRRAERRISGVGFRWCAAPRLRTWCLTPRKPLFFRPQTPRLSGPKRRRRTGRGASLPANPYSFAHKHHVSRVKGAGGVPDVVPHSPQTLIPSSGSTTSLGSNGTSTSWTWCLTPRKPLFLRPGAPRPQVRMDRRRHCRGASLPAIPYSFVEGHHVPRSGWADAGTDVVLHSPQSLVPSFPLHQVFGLFRSFNPSDLVQRLPQNLISPFPLLHVFVPFRRSNPSDLVHESPKNLVLSFPLHQVFGLFRSSNPSDLVQILLQSLIPSSRGTTSSTPDGIGKGSADEFAIRLHFLPLLFCIDRKSSGAIAPLLFLHNPIKFYYFTFPLLFGAV